MLLSKYLMIPKMAWLSLGAPRNQKKAWDLYWNNIQRTGRQGDVLWDTDSKEELKESQEVIQKYMNTNLPMIDIGCGNGTYTRMLSKCFDRVVGFDVANAAIENARKESVGIDNVEYRVTDATKPNVGLQLAKQFGDSNVYMRGVFHLLGHRERSVLVQNIAEILGQNGTLYMVETNHGGDPLDLLTHLGATAASLPNKVQHLIESGIRMPRSVSAQTYRQYFSDAEWNTLLCDETNILTKPVKDGDDIISIRAFCAVAQRRVEHS